MKKKTPIWSTILLVSSPFVLFAILLTMIYLPKALANPQYDFIFSICDDYPCKDYKFDSQGKIINYQSENDSGSRVQFYNTRLGRSYSYGYNYDEGTEYPTLYRYRLDKDTAYRISIDEYNELQVSRAEQSPDGYKLVKNVDSSANLSFAFLSFSSRGSWSLNKGIARRNLDIDGKANYWYRDDVKVVGWVK